MVSKGSLQKSIVLANESLAFERLCQKLLGEAAEYGFGQKDIFAVHLALEEAFLNALKHGNKMNPNKKVHVKYLITPEKFDISIKDDGSGFDPAVVPDPREGENLYKSSGRGLLLMQSYMDEVEFNKTGNCVRMIKFIEKKKRKTESENIQKQGRAGI